MCQTLDMSPKGKGEGVTGMPHAALAVSVADDKASTMAAARRSCSAQSLSRSNFERFDFRPRDGRERSTSNLTSEIQCVKVMSMQNVLPLRKCMLRASLEFHAATRQTLEALHLEPRYS